MRRILFGLAVSVLMAASAQATPSLGYWNEGDFHTTHQYWDFNVGYVNPIISGLEVFPEPPVVNPNVPAVRMQVSAPAVWDQQNDRLVGSLLVLDMKLPNYPELNAHKDVWVDLGLTQGDVVSASVVAGDGLFHYEALQGPGPNGLADFGFRIYPNPQWENVQIVILGGAAAAMLEYAHIDTICIPAPGAMLLVSVGAGFVGWLRRRRAL